MLFFSSFNFKLEKVPLVTGILEMMKTNYPIIIPGLKLVIPPEARPLF